MQTQSRTESRVMSVSPMIESHFPAPGMGEERGAPSKKEIYTQPLCGKGGG